MSLGGYTLCRIPPIIEGNSATITPPMFSGRLLCRFLRGVLKKGTGVFASYHLKMNGQMLCLNIFRGWKERQ
jgi:hypothetical protein